jgi:hypothetical protein
MEPRVDEYITAESRFTEDQIAYADDLAIIVQGNSRHELDRRMVGAMSDLTALAPCHNLCFQDGLHGHERKNA